MRRLLVKFTAIFIVLGLMVCSSANAKESFKAGKQYLLINPMVTPSPRSDGKVTVTEFFNYACPACYGLEPTLEAWLANKPNNVVFTRVAVIPHPLWDNLAKAYYVAQVLGVERKMTPLIFAALHKQKLRLYSKSQITNFFAKNGVDRALFIKYFNHTPAIDKELNHGVILVQRYRVRVIPTIVIAGKYQTSPAMTKNNKQLMQVVDYLIAKAGNSNNKN